MGRDRPIGRYGMVDGTPQGHHVGVAGRRAGAPCQPGGDARRGVTAGNCHHGFVVHPKEPARRSSALALHLATHALYAAAGLTATAAAAAVAAAGPALPRARPSPVEWPRASVLTPPPHPPESTPGQSRWRAGRHPIARVSPTTSYGGSHRVGEGGRFPWRENLFGVITAIYGDVDQTVRGAPRGRRRASGPAATYAAPPRAARGAVHRIGIHDG